MHYLFALMIVCAFVSSHIAARKGRGAVAWWFIGLVPVLGVMLAFLMDSVVPGVAPRRRRGFRKRKPAPERKRPKRCCGAYVPECWGCPFFRRSLFDPDPQEGKRGYCEHYRRELTEPQRKKGPDITVEES